MMKILSSIFAGLLLLVSLGIPAIAAINEFTVFNKVDYSIWVQGVDFNGNTTCSHIVGPLNHKNLSCDNTSSVVIYKDKYKDQKCRKNVSDTATVITVKAGYKCSVSP